MCFLYRQLHSVLSQPEILYSFPLISYHGALCSTTSLPLKSQHLLMHLFHRTARRGKWAVV